MFNVAEELPSMQVGHTLRLLGLAAVVVLLVVAGYMYFNRVSPSADGEVLEIKLYQPQPAVSDIASTSVPQANSLLAFATVEITNKSTKPLSLQDLSGVVKIGDTDYRSFAASPIDFDRVFRYYDHDLAYYRKPPLFRHTMIQPGESLRGMVVFNYALTEDEWNQAESFKVTGTFDNIPELVRLSWNSFPAHGRIVSLPPVTAPVVARHRRSVSATS
jgi:hypothetical protein